MQNDLMREEDHCSQDRFHQVFFDLDRIVSCVRSNRQAMRWTWVSTTPERCHRRFQHHVAVFRAAPGTVSNSSMCAHLATESTDFEPHRSPIRLLLKIRRPDSCASSSCSRSRSLESWVLAKQPGVTRLTRYQCIGPKVLWHKSSRRWNDAEASCSVYLVQLARICFTRPALAPSWRWSLFSDTACGLVKSISLFAGSSDFPAASDLVKLLLSSCVLLCSSTDS